MQQAIINAVPTQINPQQTTTQLTHSLVTLTLGASDIGVHSALTTTQLSCNDNRLGRDSVALFYSKQ